jgi:hypothetical protein
MFQLGPRLAFTWYILGARPNCAQVFGHLRTQPTGNSKRLMLPRPHQGTRTKPGHKKMHEIRKFEPTGGRDPLLLLAEEIRELRREQRMLLDQAGKASDRLKLVSRAALAGCILLSLELIVDILTTVLRATP